MEERYFIREFKDEEYGVYVRAGAIVPILLHKRELSLLRAIGNPIMLEIYLDPRDMSARGMFVLDDGLTVEKKVTRVEVEFVDEILSVRVVEGSNYHSSKVINQVRIFGLNQLPKRVDCLSKSRCSTVPAERNYRLGIADFWEYETRSLMVVDLNYEIDPTIVTKEKIFQLVNYRYQLG